MHQPPRWPFEAWFPLVAGLAWLWLGASGGALGFLLALAPGVLLLSSGASKLLWPGDRRIQQYAALGGVLGVLLGMPGWFVLGFWPATLLMVLSAAAFVAAGAVAVRQEPHLEDVPRPAPSVRLATQVAIDEALLATMNVSNPSVRTTDALDGVRAEVDAARDLFVERGWIEKPESYHVAPPALEAPRVSERSVRVRGRTVEYEHLTFESGYAPHDGEPGSERWLAYTPNRTAHAWVLRHRDEKPRGWLLCIHGYQMGTPTMDIGAFDPSWLHRELGLNLVLPVLPLHGHRKIGRRSGDGFLAGNPLDSIHAEAQAMWDLRRLIGWARNQGATAVGAYGLSLGGYTTALLAGVADDLACAIPGIPPTDFARLIWRHGPALEIRFMEHHGVVHDELAEVMRVISPLAVEPKLPREHRAIFGGTVDRLVPPDHVRDLWRHWEQPRMVWYQGAHLTFMLDPRVRAMVSDTIRGSALGDASGSEAVPADQTSAA